MDKPANEKLEPVDERLELLLYRRGELMLARDILALQLEIRDLKEALKTNGDTHTEEG